jgi:hypothetical protein
MCIEGGGRKQGVENRDEYMNGAMEGSGQTPAGTPLFPIPRGERVSPFPED